MISIICTSFFLNVVMINSVATARAFISNFFTLGPGSVIIVFTVIGPIVVFLDDIIITAIAYLIMVIVFFIIMVMVMVIIGIIIYRVMSMMMVRGKKRRIITMYPNMVYRDTCIVIAIDYMSMMINHYFYK